MATPSDKITKTAFLNNYNIDVVLTSKIDIMKCLETFNSKNQAVMIGTKKQHTLSIEDRVSRLEEGFLNIDKKLDLIIQRLDRHEQLFREHGWIK